MSKTSYNICIDKTNIRVSVCRIKNSDPGINFKVTLHHKAQNRVP